MKPVRKRIFGEVEGFPEGSTFGSRAELSQAGVHTPRRAGISGNAKEGADSIVLSGGYEDDVDEGDVIVYTGQGGRDDKTGEHVNNQALVRQNLALAMNRLLGLPVRVVRGHLLGSSFAPKQGYRYDGLYWVEDHWKERGRSGYQVWRFKLVKQTPQKDL
jgi:putative restriction endonuclease